MAERLISLIPFLVAGVVQGHFLPVITDCEYTDLDELWVDGLTEGCVIKVDHPAIGCTREYRLAYAATAPTTSAVACGNTRTGWWWVPNGGNVKNIIVVTTATGARTLLAGESGSLISNVGSAGAAVVNLPAAIPGLFFEFLVEAAQTLTIEPATGETIALPSTGVQEAANDYIVADALTEKVRLVCVTVGTWDSFDFTGNWTGQ